MTQDVYWIDGVSPGRLGIIPRPRGGDWLKREVQAWRAANIDTVVSLLTPDENTELDLVEEETECRDAGIQFHSFPIPDCGLPSSRASLEQVVAALRSDLELGKSVVAHCRQGIGRSALLLASVLVRLGEHPDHAFRQIEDARGQPVPDTDAQRDWVRGYAEILASAAQQSAAADPDESGPLSRRR